MTTEQVIERAERQGLTREQIDYIVNQWMDANIWRIGQGYPPVPLEDAMPQIVEVK